MSFSSKKLQSSRSRGMGFIKGATLFFLGASCVLFATRAFNIVPIAPNAVQYIQSIFLTTDGSNVPGSERITLDGTNGNGYFAGKVGIGTATPASKLHLLDSNSTTLTLQCLDGDCNNRINFIEDGTTGLYIRTDESDIAENQIRGLTQTPLVFATYNTERMRINANGNVGIGTNDPDNKLHVAGTGQFSGVKITSLLSSCLGTDAAGNVIGTGCGGGTTAVPGGTTKNIQFNDTGTFSGDSNLVRNSTTGYMGIGTATPDYSLHIKNIVDYAGIFLQGYMSMIRFGSQRGGSWTDFREIKRGGSTGANLEIYYSSAYPSGPVMTITTGGNLGIGTDTPSAKLDISLSGGNNIFVREGPSDDVPQIYSTSGLYIGADQVKVGSDQVIIGETNGIIVKGGYAGSGNTNKVGIGTGDPQELLHVAQNGKAQFGNYLKLYSNTYNGVIQTDNSTSSIVLNTSGTNTRMTINASGYVGINQTDPTANLEVQGTMKILSSLTGKVGYSTGIRWYFPQGVNTGTMNTGLDTDSIWYISCDGFSTTGVIFLYGLKGSNISFSGGNMYFTLRGGGYSTLTYHLKAGETFFIYNNCLDGLSIFKQEYGKNATTIGGGHRRDSGAYSDLLDTYDIGMEH